MQTRVLLAFVNLAEMDEIDIKRAAGLMIELYGSAASLSAKARGKRAFDLGSTDGFHAWKRVADAISDMERKKAEFSAGTRVGS